MNSTPNSNRLHISIFGNRNSGKSTLINALTNQDLAIVSDTPGTTADPVSKAMEILPIGPVVITDTAGYDDVGELGRLRTKKTIRQTDKTDIAIVVIDGNTGFTASDEGFIKDLKERKIPIIGVINKADLIKETDGGLFEREKIPYVIVSAKEKEGIDKLKELIIKESAACDKEISIVEGLIEAGDVAVLVMPIDSAAPKGRLILPQQQTLRAILDKSALAVVVKETELEAALKSLKEKPKIVITDSQAFEFVSSVTPDDVALTSFSILFARYKGELKPLIKGINKISSLKPADKVLICEGCTHHRQCDDIGTVKIPRWLNKLLGFTPDLSFSSGTEFPENLSDCALIIHCGGCMLNSAEMKSRLKKAEAAGVPITNYGMFIAYATGITERALKPIPEAREIIGE